MTGANPQVCKRAIVKGIVQGVGFRASTHRQAQKIGGLQGWVRNLADGSVEILVQGEPARVEQLLSWCNQGPRLSRVDQVVVEDRPVDPNLGSFTVA